MSLFGSLMGDLEEDPIFGQMNSVMNSFFGGNPFGGLLGGMGMQPFGGMMRHNALMAPHPNPMMEDRGMFAHQNAMMPFGFPAPMARPGASFMQNMMTAPGSSSFTSTSYVTMSAGPDGRQQIYQASSSTKTGPNGVMETKKTVQDSRTGVKKMAIGHHIYDRGHIIEREQNFHEGTEEERQDFINLEEDEAEEFNREFMAKSGSNRRGGPSIQCIETGPLGRQQIPAIMPAPSPQASTGNATTVTGTGTQRTETSSSGGGHDVDVEEESDEGPIVELPDSPSPPEAQSDGEEEEQQKRRRDQMHNNSTVEEQEEDEDEEEEEELDVSNTRGGESNARVSIGNGGNGLGYEDLSRMPNVLGIQPRKPIRTHEASPLPSTQARSPHSIRSSGSAHPYNAQSGRKTSAHRPMKGTVQHHHHHQHSHSYHHPQQHQQNPQYERDN